MNDNLVLKTTSSSCGRVTTPGFFIVLIKYVTVSETSCFLRDEIILEIRYFTTNKYPARARLVALMLDFMRKFRTEVKSYSST